MSREKLRRAALPPVQKNIDKLEKAINEGNFYGAQQMYKSISARFDELETALMEMVKQDNRRQLCDRQDQKEIEDACRFAEQNAAAQRCSVEVLQEHMPYALFSFKDRQGNSETES